MKKLSLVISLFLCSFLSPVFCQDIIVLKTGDEIKAKITEIGTDVVKYKKWENIDGPVYSSEKEKIFMVKYQNGAKDIFNDSPSKPKTTTVAAEAPLSKPTKNRPIRFERLYFGGGIFHYGDDNSIIRFNQVGNIMSKVPAAYNQFSNARNKEIWALVTSILGGTGLVIGLTTSDETTAGVSLLSSVVLSSTGAILQFSAMKGYENAAYTYTSASLSYQQPKVLKYQFGLGKTKSGVGLICTF